MIEGCVGLPGQGKTLYAVRRLLMESGRGRLVAANFTSTKGIWRRVVWDDVLETYDAFVCLDEAHMWFPSRNWKSTQQDELALFQQSRKSGLDLLWCAQNEQRLDVALRELTAYVHHVRRLGPFIFVNTVEGCGARRVGKRSVFYGPPFYSQYWTEERVLGRGERSTEPIVGVLPNWARFEDSPGRIRWEQLERDSAAVADAFHAGARLFYFSPYGGRVEWTSRQVGHVSRAG